MAMFDLFPAAMHPLLPPSWGSPRTLEYRTPCPHEAGYAVMCRCFEPPTLATVPRERW
jgi:hypothetical protein